MAKCTRAQLIFNTPAKRDAVIEHHQPGTSNNMAVFLVWAKKKKNVYVQSSLIAIQCELRSLGKASLLFPSACFNCQCAVATVAAYFRCSVLLFFCFFLYVCVP